jgi:hypothetical protein
MIMNSKQEFKRHDDIVAEGRMLVVADIMEYLVAAGILDACGTGVNREYRLRPGVTDAEWEAAEAEMAQHPDIAWMLPGEQELEN